MLALVLAAALTASLYSTRAVAEEVALRAIASLPTTNDFTKRFLAYINKVNEAGKNIVRINFVGGPEAIPPQQQDTALRNGVFDVQGGPASYYLGTVPEASALKGANVSPAEIRKNGAFAQLEKIWKRRLNVKLVGWTGGGVQFYIYLKSEPKLTDQQVVDLRGIRLRSVPTYRAWFERLGATAVTMEASDIFTGLERGVVDGLGWPAISFVDLGIQRFVKYRVGPPVWQNDAVIIVNQARWDALSPQAKDVLTQAAIDLENENQKVYAEQIRVEENALKQAGVILYDLPDAAAKKHVNLAHTLVWDDLARVSAAAARDLRPLMYKE